VFEALLKLLARELDRAQIPYMIIGGQAVQLYGEPRMTRDIDLTLGLDSEGLDRVLRVCGACGLKPLPAAPAEFVRETMVLPALEERTGIRVDFIFSFTDYERQAIGRSRPVELGGVGVRFATVEDVVIHKLVAGRPRDLEDVRSIVVKNPGLDRGYVEEWLGGFDRALDRDITSSFRRLLES
jgi:predicted nucleotidyltransferase